jgi:hypothetical protein
VQLTVNVSDDDDGGVGAAVVDPDTIGFFVKDLGGAKNQAIEYPNGKYLWKLGRGKISGRPIEHGHEVLGPIQAELAVGRPFDWDF